MSSYLALNSPFAQPLHQLGLELVFAVAAALTLRDAVRGGRAAQFGWLCAFAYGIEIELVTYNFFDNFTHARFTVQLYHLKLPFYVVCVYPVFLYSALRLVQRWRLGALQEALLCGLAACLIDVPFDIVGADINWWHWSDKDPNLAFRWLGVPITSYYWYLLFGAIYALLCRALAPRLGRRPLALSFAAAPLVGLAVIVLGILAFLPFHGLKALGVREDLIVLLHLAGCAALALSVRPRGPLSPLGALVFAPLLVALYHLTLMAALPGIPDRAAGLAAGLAAALGLYRLVAPPEPTAAPEKEPA